MTNHTNDAAANRNMAPAPEPRWPAIVAVVAAAAIFTALPPHLVLGPRWLVLVLVLALTAPYVLLNRSGLRQAARVLGYLNSAVITLFLLASLFLLVRAMLRHQGSPGQMLTSAACLWVANILVFALWYWRLDAGGPHARESRGAHEMGAFLFPQMTMRGHPAANWRPPFIDYLFLAFKTSTAFSPTDTAILSRWGKALIMLQSLMSLTIVALLAARAVNIL